MSEMSMIAPPKVAVAAEASAGHKILSPQPRKENASGITPPKPVHVQQQQRMAQFGGQNNVQINRRGEAPVTKLAPQTISVMQSTLTSAIRFCKAEGATQAQAVFAQALALVRSIASGSSIADPAPAPAPAPAQTITPPPAQGSAK